ncbi:MAG: hypothetical protein LBU39_04470 [Desulfobulbaceae bacterium]|jgi:glycerophosphoryl diester phosphodiesterase|nr:hypothetical protein [Desulfobulbaceae bacterium]
MSRCIALCLLCLSLAAPSQAAPLTYAWLGGESGILRNSLPAVLLAAGRADATHLKVVATRDDQLLLAETPDLTRFTDVAAVFPDRLREDGSAASLDFTLAEIRRLRRLPKSADGANQSALPSGLSTLEEALALSQVMATRLGQAPTFIIEPVEPSWHRQSGKDLSQFLLQRLDQLKIAPDDSHIMFMSEDGAEMQRLAKELLPEAGRKHRLIQMIGPEPPPKTDEASGQPPVPDVNEWAFTQLGLRVIAGYAYGVAIDKSRLVTPQGTPSQGEYLARAKKLGLLVFVYPIAPNDAIKRISAAVTPAAPPQATSDKGETPPSEIQPTLAVETVSSIDFFSKSIGVDGLFYSQLPDAPNALEAAAPADTVEAGPGDGAGK